MAYINGKEILFSAKVTQTGGESPGGGAGEMFITPLTVTKNGTYETFTKGASVTWGIDTEYDISFAADDDTTINFKKVDNLIVPDDISEFDNPAYYYSNEQNGGTITQSLSDWGVTEVTDDDGDVIGYATPWLGILVIWVKKSFYFNEDLEEPIFEDDAVYVSDYLKYNGWTKGTLVAPSNDAMAVSPVTVDVEPKLGSIKITKNGIYLPSSNADGFDRVKVDYEQEELKALADRTITDIAFPLGHVEDYAFYGCTSLTSVKFGGSCKIGNHAFLNCSALKQVTSGGLSTKYQGENVISADYIKTDAFRGTALSGRLRIHTSDIRANAFAYTKVKSVDIIFDQSGWHTPIRLASGSFVHCNELEKVYIWVKQWDYNANSISSDAFPDCPNLKTILIDSERPIALTGHVYNFPLSLQAIYVPESAVDLYKSAEGWSDRAEIIFPFPKYDVTFVNKDFKYLDYYNESDGTWVKVTDGLTLEQVSYVKLRVSSNYNYCKIGTNTNGENIVLSYSQALSYSGMKLYPRENETWNVTETTQDWYKVIHFTIDNTSFSATGDMTWAEWLESKYNTINAVAIGNNIKIDGENDDIILHYYYGPVLLTDRVYSSINTYRFREKT